MSRARNVANLGDGIVTADITDGQVTAGKLASTLDLTGKTVTLPAGTGGKVLQVVSASTTTQTSTTSTSYVDTGITASITPSSASNKIMVIVACPVKSQTTNSTGADNQKMSLFRGATQLTSAPSGTREGYGGGHSDYVYSGSHLSYLDSPATTSSVTYIVKIKANGGGTTIYAPHTGDSGVITLMEIAG